MVNDQKPKLKLQSNSIEIKGLLNIGADTTVISQKSLNSEWLLQMIYI